MSLASYPKTREHLTVRWKDTDRPLLRQLFPLLAQGRPISAAHFSKITGKDIAIIEQALVEGRTERDPQGNVIELFGIMLVPTLHRIQIGQVCLFSCCALVAHMTPLLLGQTATIESVDPVSRRLVRLHVSPTGVQSVEPESSVATLVVTTQEQVLKDVRAAFCMHVCHFPDIQTAQEFITADTRRYVVSIEELHDAARQLKVSIWD